MVHPDYQQMVFINLPVRDLARSRSFYEGLGYSFDDRFCDDTAACLVISETIFAMLLTHEKMANFTDKRIIDAKTEVQVLNCLSAPSRDAVNALVDRAGELGATTDMHVEDHGFMFGRNFEDPDGNVWEIMWMDVDAAMQSDPGGAAVEGAN